MTGNIAVRGGTSFDRGRGRNRYVICSVCALAQPALGTRTKVCPRHAPDVHRQAAGSRANRAAGDAKTMSLRSNSDHQLGNASLARQNESMAMRIESLAEELAAGGREAPRGARRADGRGSSSTALARVLGICSTDGRSGSGGREAERAVEAARAAWHVSPTT